MPKLMMDFLDLIEREDKPRTRGLTAVYERGVGPTQLAAIFEMQAPYIDYFKMDSYTYRLYPEALVAAKIDLCHQNDIKVILGGNVGELAWLQGCWDRLADEGRKFGWDAFEISETYVHFTEDEKIRMAKRCTDLGYEIFYEWGEKKPKKPFDPDQAANDVLMMLEQGAKIVVLEEGELDVLLGPDGSAPHADLLVKFLDKVGIENVMLEATQLNQLVWLLKSFGSSVNLGPNITLETQLRLEPLRRGIGRGVDYFHYDKFLKKRRETA